MFSALQSAMRNERPSAGRAGECDHRDRRRAVPRPLADIRRGLPAGRQGAGNRNALHQQDTCRDLCARSARSRKRGRQSRGADRARAQSLVARLRGRSDRPLLPHAIADGHQRHAARGVLTGEDMARWQASVGEPLRYDYGRYSVCKAAWSQGPVLLQQLALLAGFDLDSLDMVGPDFIHSAGRVRQARLCRSRKILRRSGCRRGADEHAAVGRLQQGSAHARFGQSLAGIAARLGCQFRRAW